MHLVHEWVILSNLLLLLGFALLSNHFEESRIPAILPRFLPGDWKGGFGGSMIWFGSSAGVALSNMYPEAKSVGQWLKHGWFIAVAYVIGFFVLLAVLGWHPNERHKGQVPVPAVSETAPAGIAAGGSGG